MLAKGVGAAQLAVFAGAFAGEQLAPNLLPAETWAMLREKRGVILMGTWFLGNTLRNGLTSTGAFEVYYNGQRVFSKLATGRMPSFAEVAAGIEGIISEGAGLPHGSDSASGAGSGDSTL